MNVGRQIRKIRTEKNITLSQLGRALSISVSALSQIESSKNTPSLETLSAILKHMNVPMSDFFRQIEESDILITKNDEVETIRSEKGSRIVLLASKLQDNTLESYTVMLRPGAVITVKELPKSVNGERFVYVQEGDICLEINHASYDLKKEDSINFKAHYGCMISNVCAVIAQFIICGFPPVL